MLEGNGDRRRRGESSFTLIVRVSSMLKNLASVPPLRLDEHRRLEDIKESRGLS